MPLTYHPFAEAPALQDLSRELNKNVSDVERLASGALGVTLLLASPNLKGIAALGVLLAGGALVHRAYTGHCALYHRLNIDTNEAHAPSQRKPSEQTDEVAAH